MGGAPARELRARLYNRRVQQMKVMQGGAAGWLESRVVVWAMDVSIGKVVRNRVYKRMMLGVGVGIEVVLRRSWGRRWNSNGQGSSNLSGSTAVG